jgi:hypothetical protein
MNDRSIQFAGGARNDIAELLMADDGFPARDVRP